MAPAPLTITATSKSKAYGTALTLGTTSFTTSGLLAGATVTGVTLTSAGSAAGAAVGNYPIVPSAAVGTGLSNYAITYVPGTLTVTAVPLKITAPSPSRTYGSANPNLAPTYSGFVNGDTAAKLTTAPTCTTTATTTSGVGTYPVTCSGAVDSNYTISYAGGTLTVTRAPLKVTAPSPTRAYGSTNPVLAPTYSGFVAGDSSASLATAPTCTTTATTASGVGTYPVTCSGGVSANYTFSYVGGTLSVVVVDRFWTSAGVTLNVAAPGFLALTDVGSSTVVVSQAPKGKLTLGSTPGGFTYVPPSGWTGTDTFAYELKTGNKLSSPVTVTIYVLRSGASCVGCNLSGLQLGALVLTGVNYSNANLAAVGLSGANLSGSNLSGASLTGASLTGATLTGANLSNANLTAADFTGATTAGVTWSGATCPDGTSANSHGHTCVGHLTPIAGMVARAVAASRPGAGLALVGDVKQTDLIR